MIYIAPTSGKNHGACVVAEMTHHALWDVKPYSTQLGVHALQHWVGNRRSAVARSASRSPLYVVQNNDFSSASRIFKWVTLGTRRELRGSGLTGEFYAFVKTWA